MGLSNLAFQLILVLIPGIISTLIVKELTITRNWDSFKITIFTILLSGINYISLQAIYNLVYYCKSKICNQIYNYQNLDVWGSLQDNVTIPFNEILHASLLSVLIGFFASKIVQEKWLFRLSKQLNVSHKFGEENLFYQFMRDKETTEIYIKDLSKNLVYHGILSFYSESSSIREIVLTNVNVYSYDESKLYYCSPKIYLSENIQNSWIIEYPDLSKLININTDDNSRREESTIST
ncbi:MAG: hypothetical protein WAT79_07205 [Saprospiraceae bacterium]